MPHHKRRRRRCPIPSEGAHGTTLCNRTDAFNKHTRKPVSVKRESRWRYNPNSCVGFALHAEQTRLNSHGGGLRNLPFLPTDPHGLDGDRSLR